MIIRPANIHDFDDIWNMWKEVMEQGAYFPYDESYTRTDIETSWINTKNDAVVVERDCQVVGAYILRPNQPGRGKHIANASYLVATSHRGQGIGKRLGEHSVSYARELGYLAMQFNLVVSTNTAAVKAWQQSGFRIIGTIPEAFNHSEQGFVDAHIMYRKL